MEAKHMYRKGLLLLDAGRFERGESVLHETIELAEQQKNDIVLGQASCVLGKLLFQQDRYEEAQKWLNVTLSIKIEGDLLDEEHNLCRKILNQLTTN